MNSQRKRSVLPYLFLILIPCAVLTAFFLWLRSTAAQRSDFKRIDSATYDTVFLSMYPIDTYEEADYQHFRGMTVLIADYLIPDFSTLQRYMKRITDSGNAVSTVYLGIRPDKVSAAEISALAAFCPSIAFEVVPAYPSAEYWRQLPESEYERILAAYCDFLPAISTVSGTHTYFFSAAEWLIANPALYTDNFSLTTDAAQFVMTHSDYFGGYQLTFENAPEYSAALRQLTAAQRTVSASRPDLSDTAIVFFGDSLFGNYLDGMSIPGAVSGLTGAAVYNCGYGGNPAAMNEKTIITLPGIAAAFAEQDLTVLPREAQVYAGIAEYIAHPPQAEKLCFVISYGVNDYLNGQPVSSGDPYDITTYIGAVRTAVSCLQENYADARILLCTPAYTPNPCGRTDLCLQDYADALISLASELNVDVIDNYRYLGIDKTNYSVYLPDQLHPNEEGRFMFALQIINALCK